MRRSRKPHPLVAGAAVAFAALGDDEHALHGAVALGAGEDRLVVLQGQMDDPAVIGGQGLGGLGPTQVVRLFGQVPGDLSELVVLAFAVVAGVHLDAHRGLHLAGDQPVDQVLDGGQGLPFAADDQAGVLLVVDEDLDPVGLQGDLHGSLAHDGGQQLAHDLAHGVFEERRIELGHVGAGALLTRLTRLTRFARLTGLAFARLALAATLLALGLAGLLVAGLAGRGGLGRLGLGHIAVDVVVFLHRDDVAIGFVLDDFFLDRGRFRHGLGSRGLGLALGLGLGVALGLGLLLVAVEDVGGVHLGAGPGLNLGLFHAHDPKDAGRASGEDLYLQPFAL